VPQRPLALELVDRVASMRGVAERLAAGDYRAAGIEEESTEPPWKAGFGDPFRRARVTVVLESSADGARAVLVADVIAGDDGGLTLVRLIPSVTGDPALAALLRE
jgi:hypothetical protein